MYRSSYLVSILIIIMNCASVQIDEKSNKQEYKINQGLFIPNIGESGPAIGLYNDRLWYITTDKKINKNDNKYEYRFMVDGIERLIWREKPYMDNENFHDLYSKSPVIYDDNVAICSEDTITGNQFTYKILILNSKKYYAISCYSIHQMINSKEIMYEYIRKPDNSPSSDVLWSFINDPAIEINGILYFAKSDDRYVQVIEKTKSSIFIMYGSQSYGPFPTKPVNMIVEDNYKYISFQIEYNNEIINYKINENGEQRIVATAKMNDQGEYSLILGTTLIGNFKKCSRWNGISYKISNDEKDAVVQYCDNGKETIWYRGKPFSEYDWMYNYEIDNNNNIIFLYSFEGTRYLRYNDKLFSNVRTYSIYNNKIHLALFNENKISHIIIQ